jgi:hypothetical protein
MGSAHRHASKPTQLSLALGYLQQMLHMGSKKVTEEGEYLLRQVHLSSKIARDGHLLVDLKRMGSSLGPLLLIKV